MKRVLVACVLCVGLVCLSHAAVTVDAGLPAGNIVFEKIEGDTVYVHQDLRDTTTPWFYWAMRVKGAAGRKLCFKFTASHAVGMLGPVVSLDQGRSYSYAAQEGAGRRSFVYSFPKGADEVWFYQAWPYAPADWERFLSAHEAVRGKWFESGTLCLSRKGREVPRARFGRLDGKARHRIYMCSRHHCGETTGTMVLEGVASAFLAEDDLGAWLRENVELLAVPFVDYDGVVDGDQGKCRAPHDHNRDYGEFLYPETRAIVDWLKTQVDNRIDIYIDCHSPWLFGGENDRLYTPWKDPAIVRDAGAEQRFSNLLEKLQTGSMRYRAADDLPFGVGWNNSQTYKAGWSSEVWALKTLKDLKIGRTYEVPFALANGATVTPDACRELGRDTAKVFRAFFTPPAREKVIFDTDIGADIDDQAALLYLAKEPRCELLGVTTVGGASHVRASLASAILKDVGRDDVKVYPGVSQPLVDRCDSEDGVEHLRRLKGWPHATYRPGNVAIEWMRQTIHANPGEVTIVSVGPFSNLAALFAVDPACAGMVKRVVAMGGNFAGGGPEWNALRDAYATEILVGRHRLHRVRDLTFFGNDVTRQTRMEEDVARAYFKSRPAFRILDALSGDWLKTRHNATLHDPLAAVALFHPEVCTYGYADVEVTPSGAEAGKTSVRGEIAATPDAARRIRVATGVDRERFYRVFGEIAGDERVAAKLWTGAPFPKKVDLPRVEGVRFSQIKAFEPEKDGFKWLHGVALAWHENRLYASYGTNPGVENTAGERCHARYSEDEGRTWSEPQLVAGGEISSRLAVSHGALLSEDGRLYSFMGAFTNHMEGVHTRLAVLEPEATGWRDLGPVAKEGFWPMQTPVRMADGNWIMGGLRVAKGVPGAKGDRPAVAISAGSDFTHWTVVPVEEGEIANCWGEATVDVDGANVTLTSRPGWKNDPSVAFVAISSDSGRTWSPMRATNLPLATAKPFTGCLSDGRRYAIGSMSADGLHARDSIVVAFSRPGEWSYSSARLVRAAKDDIAGCEQGVLSYPYAVEHNDKLYIGYSNLGGRGGNFNSAELAVVPLKAEGRARDAAGAAALPQDGQAAVKASVFHWTINQIMKARKLTLPQTAELLFSLGVKGLDCDYKAKGLADYVAAGFVPASLFGFMDFYAPDGGRAACDEFIATAVKYGVPRIMCIPSSFTDGRANEPEYLKNREALAYLVAQGKKAGVTVTVEDFGNPQNPCAHVSYLKRLMTEIPDLQFALDSGNLYYSGTGGDILEMMAFAKGRVAHVHLKDQAKGSAQEFVSLGLGAVPNEQIVRTMCAQGYDGWYTIENPVGDDPVEDIVRQLGVLRAWCR